MTSFVSRFADWGASKLAQVHPLETRGKKVVELREKRADLLERWSETGIGPPVYEERQIEVIVDLCLQEARLRPDFNPDLLIVTEPQYKSMFDIPAGVPINPDEWHHYYDTAGTESDKQRILPPIEYSVDAGTIDVVYSSEADSMLLVESDNL